MYDIDREIDPSLCEFKNHELCYYIDGQTGRIESFRRKAHHYQKENAVGEMVQNICRELFYYSSSLQKVTAKYEQAMVQSVLLENIKRITVHNCDKYGLIPEQKLFYLIVSYLHSRMNHHHNNTSRNLQQYLIEVHYILTSMSWKQPNQQIPFSLVMLLNGQFEELLNYTREELLSKSSSQLLLQNLVDLLVYKIEQSDNGSINSQASQQFHIITSSSSLSFAMIDQLREQINNSQWMKSLIVQIRKKNTNVFSLFQQSSKHEIEIILGVLCGNESLIEEVCKGSWGLYLNLYVSYVVSWGKNSAQNIDDRKSHLSYQEIINAYTQKYSHITTSSKTFITSSQQLLIKLISSSKRQISHHYSFHEIYQQSFNLLSPILSHLMGLLMLQCKLVDLHSLINNNDYYQQIILNLIDDCNAIGWGSFFHIIGFVNNHYHNNSNNNNNNSSNIIWQNLMYKHLSYQIQLNNNHNPLNNQIKQIQQKLSDLNIVGLSSLTKSYLTTLFNLQLSPSNSLNQLNPCILQVFFLILQMTDSSTVNSTFHLIKSFLTQYYCKYYFNYELLDCLQDIFERKRAVLSQKMQSKIQKLFSLSYKIKAIYQINMIDDNQCGDFEHERSVLLQQLQQFNKLFITSKNKKTISLSVQLLRLASRLHQCVETTIGVGTQVQMEIQPMASNQAEQQQEVMNHKEKYDSLQLVKDFHKNLSNYLQQWRTYSSNSNHRPQHQLSEHALHQLAYFQQFFY